MRVVLITQKAHTVNVRTIKQAEHVATWLGGIVTGIIQNGL